MLCVRAPGTDSAPKSLSAPFTRLSSLAYLPVVSQCSQQGSSFHQQFSWPVQTLHAVSLLQVQRRRHSFCPLKCWTSLHCQNRQVWYALLSTCLPIQVPLKKELFTTSWHVVLYIDLIHIILSYNLMSRYVSRWE